MTPEEVGERMIALLADDDAAGEVVASVSGGGAGHERAVIDVPVARWWAAVGAARDPGALGCDFFDWLSAVDELDQGFSIVAHLWSTRRRHGLLMRARVPRENPVVESVVDLFPGAAWHERETHEMFGIGFSRHPGLRPLLLPPGFEGNPLRKEFVLASRVAKAWPGAKEPGESEAGGPAKRAPMRPPGVPDPNEWGPLKGTIAPPETPARGARAARPPRERPPATAATSEAPARPASEVPANPASEMPAGPASEVPAHPAPGDRPARSVERPATPGTPGDPKAELKPEPAGPPPPQSPAPQIPAPPTAQPPAPQPPAPPAAQPPALQPPAPPTAQPPAADGDGA